MRRRRAVSRFAAQANFARAKLRPRQRPAEATNLVIVSWPAGDHLDSALTPATSLTALIDNVFDRRYYRELSSVNFVHYGEPRRFTLMLQHRF